MPTCQVSGFSFLMIIFSQPLSRWKNCIRQTVYDSVALDYEKVTVLIDATAAARPDIHLASIRDMRTIGVKTTTLEEWRHSVCRWCTSFLELTYMPRCIEVNKCAATS